MGAAGAGDDATGRSTEEKEEREGEEQGEERRARECVTARMLSDTHAASQQEGSEKHTLIRPSDRLDACLSGVTSARSHDLPLVWRGSEKKEGGE